MSKFALALIGGCALALMADAALADPPGRVGRISDVEGSVSFLPPGQDDWTWADRNFPVTTGESFWTGDDGRVELQAGVMDIRADSDTELDVVALDYGQTRLGLTQGSVDLRLWRLPRGGVTIATPAGDVIINQPGVYRLDVGAAQDDGSYPPVELTVFEGDASAPGPEGFNEVQAGDAALIYAGYDPEVVDAQDAAIDDWARLRESSEHWDTQAAYDPAMTGYEELAGEGEFVSDQTYGTVWFPSQVPDDWAPYRFGHWAYVNPWGYTWIDDQPWGFAPFHYGRWVQVEGRWGWVAGQPDEEPVYAPALVAFFGVGASIGWAPLAPDEVYRPSYDISDTYLRRVNVASVRPDLVRNITINTTVNISQYRNAGAAVMVGSDTLARGGRVQTAATRAAPSQLAQAAPAVHALPPPTPEARAGGGPRVNAAGSARAAAPPSRVEAIRTSVKAAPIGSTRPPVIAGASIAPPKPRPTGAPAFVAPAQVKNPAAQARRAVPPPANSGRSNSAGTAGMGSTAGSPPVPRPMTRPLQRPPAENPPTSETQPHAMPGLSGPPVRPEDNAGPSRPMTRPMPRPPASNPPASDVEPNAAPGTARPFAHPGQRAAPSRPNGMPGEAQPNAGPPARALPERPAARSPDSAPAPKKEAKPKPDEKQPPQ